MQTLLVVDCAFPGTWYTNNEVIKMIDMKEWLDKFLTALDDCFGGRVWFVGLQGSRAVGRQRRPVTLIWW